ncbi:MAG: hypothetical protein ACI8TP_005145 [Acidimicrobiales bacterium]|jgi:hypothetical protein
MVRPRTTSEPKDPVVEGAVVEGAVVEGAVDEGVIDEGAPWAMQLAARVEKANPPTTPEVCVAAVRAVIDLLSDHRAAPGGPWEAPIGQWQEAGKIRKLVRRGRASAWVRAQDPDGRTAVAGRAEVRAYVPSPMDEVPDQVAKLQIKSTPLDQPPPLASYPLHTPDVGRMVIVVTPAVEMSWGKQAAQCAHAAQLLWRQLDSAVERRGSAPTSQSNWCGPQVRSGRQQSSGRWYRCEMVASPRSRPAP